MQGLLSGCMQLPKQRRDDNYFHGLKFPRCQVITAIFLKDTLDAASNDAEHLVVVAWKRLVRLFVSLSTFMRSASLPSIRVEDIFGGTNSS